MHYHEIELKWGVLNVKCLMSYVNISSELNVQFLYVVSLWHKRSKVSDRLSIKRINLIFFILKAKFNLKTGWLTHWRLLQSFAYTNWQSIFWWINYKLFHCHENMEENILPYEKNLWTITLPKSVTSHMKETKYCFLINNANFRFISMSICSTFFFSVFIIRQKGQKVTSSTIVFVLRYRIWWFCL